MSGPVLIDLCIWVSRVTDLLSNVMYCLVCAWNIGTMGHTWSVHLFEHFTKGSQRMFVFVRRAVRTAVHVRLDRWDFSLVILPA